MHFEKISDFRVMIVHEATDNNVRDTYDSCLFQQFSIITCNDNCNTILASIQQEKPNIVLIAAKLLMANSQSLLEKAQQLPDCPKLMAFYDQEDDRVLAKLENHGIALFPRNLCKTDALSKTILRIMRQMQEGKIKIQERSIQVERLMRKFCFPAQLRGYGYTRTAILLALQDPSLLHDMTKRLYPKVAVERNSTTLRVERGICHAIQVSWGQGNYELLDKLFHREEQDLQECPTNAEFISVIVDAVQLQLLLDH